MFDSKSFLSQVSQHPGVYQMLGENGEVLYVGKAKNLKKRLSSYFNAQEKDAKTQALLRHVKDVDITIARSENEALLLECNLIKKHRPRYNVLLRDDKSYPYIMITQEHPFPRIDFYRGPLKKEGQFFGPYPSAKAVRETITLIQKVFQLRTCSDNFFTARTRACLHHQIGLCSGSCAGLITAEEYQENVHHAVLFLQGKNDQVLEELRHKMEKAAAELHYEAAKKYRDQISKIRTLQDKQYVSGERGDADVIGYAENTGVVCLQLLSIRQGRILGSRAYYPTVPANSSQEEVITAFMMQHYLGQDIHEIPRELLMDGDLSDQALLEEALTEQAKHKVTIATSVRAERKKWVEMATHSAMESVASQLLNKSNTIERLMEFKEQLQLPILPRRMECFDISHSMGEATVASCVVFDQNGPLKSDYRRFNITGITPGDDIAAMRQALFRRYKHMADDSEKRPDIVLIDGGLAQLHAAEQVFQEFNVQDILLVGVAKGVARKPGLETLHISGKPPIHLAPDSLALHLIQQIRDEAHRFAITGHRMRRDKKRRTSSLESIPGIGAKRRRELLRYFGGIQALNRASLDELAKVPGISQSLAQRIFEALHNVTV